MIDYEKLCDIEIEDAHDYPDFADAYISYASYPDRDLTDAELDELNEDSEFVYEKCLDYWF